MEGIVISELVLFKLNNLVDALFNEKYFGLSKNAVEYVSHISSYIQTIPTLRHRPTKNPKYGAWYCEYKPNRRTSWFVTFDKKGGRYIVRNLINNHSGDYPEYIRGL